MGNKVQGKSTENNLSMHFFLEHLEVFPMDPQFSSSSFKWG